MPTTPAKNSAGFNRLRVARGAAARARGLGAEAVCAWLLRFKLYRIVARRCRMPQGEIDLIAVRGRTLVFIEVKARPDLAAGGEAVSFAQQNRIQRAAAAFLAQHPGFMGYDLRFDVMLVCPRRWPRHLPRAFEPKA